jgi:uncharacterized lipoprotein YmbA
MRTGLTVLAAALLLTACSREPEPQVRTLPAVGADPELTMSFTTDPDPPRSGSNSVRITLRRADGSPQEDANISADFYMPAMPSMNMPEMHSEFTLVHRGQGVYTGDAKLVMAGTWNVTVEVSRAGQALGRVSYVVNAK